MRFVAHRKVRYKYALNPNTQTQTRTHTHTSACMHARTHVLLKLRICQCYTIFHPQQWQFQTVQLFLIMEKKREINSFSFSTNKLPNFPSPKKQKTVTLPCHLTLFLGWFSSSHLLMKYQCPMHGSLSVQDSKNIKLVGYPSTVLYCSFQGCVCKGKGWCVCVGTKGEKVRAEHPAALSLSHFTLL